MTILGKYINLSTDPVVCTQKSGRKKNNIIRTEKRTRPVFMDKGKFNTGSRALSPFDYTILIITFRKQQQQQQKQSNLFRQFVCTDSSAEQSVLLQINNLSKSFGNICTHSTPLTTHNPTVQSIQHGDWISFACNPNPILIPTLIPLNMIHVPYFNYTAASLPANDLHSR